MFDTCFKKPKVATFGNDLNTVKTFVGKELQNLGDLLYAVKNTEGESMASKRAAYYLEINSNSVVELQLIEKNITSIAATLGYVKVAEDGALPTGKTLVGNSKEDALELGCLPLRVAYRKGTKTQSAVLLCPPSKADTVFKDLLGKTYDGKKIVKVRPIRRRRYTIA